MPICFSVISLCAASAAPPLEWVLFLSSASGCRTTSVDEHMPSGGPSSAPSLTALPSAYGLRGGAGMPGCGAELGVFSDYAAACPRSGLPARRAPLVFIEQAWVRARPWGVAADDRRRLYGATRLGEPLCRDVKLVSPARRDGRFHHRAAEHDSAVLPFARSASSFLAVRSAGAVAPSRSAGEAFSASLRVHPVGRRLALACAFCCGCGAGPW